MCTKSARWMASMVLCCAIMTICGGRAVQGGSTDTVFTYQGELVEGGNAADGSYDMTFTLWNAASGGSQVGSPIALNAVPVEQGVFTVQLDFGPSVFDNNPRWLRIQVEGTTLAPRQPITRAPYAIQTRGITVDDNYHVGLGTINPAWPLDVWAPQSVTRMVSTSSNNGSVLEMRNNTVSPASIGAINFVNSGGGTNGQIAYTGTDALTFRTGGSERARISSAGNLGIGITGPAWPLHIETNGLRCMFVRNTNSGGERYGVYAQTLSQFGRGVFGYASATSGTNFGGWFQSDSNAGRALQAYATSTTGATYGVFSLNDSSNGIAVYAWSTAGTGANIGIVGATSSTSGRGMVAVAEATSGTTYGVHSTANSPSGYDFFAGGAGVDYGSNSSIRWKKNIIPIERPLDRVSQLNGVSFDWDDAHGGRHDVGMIAEEVGAVLPEIVQYEANGVDAIGMDYSKLTPLLVEAVKQLQAEKDAEIASLREENDELRARLERVEAAMAEHFGE